jgi:predicted nucleotidyltransferase component of viral defense system
MISQGVILQWRSRAPWATDLQVEQDLVLSRAMVEIFSHPDLAGLFALRGGTSFNKFHAFGGARYSEDIDLVQIEAKPIGDALTAIRALLQPWLGKAKYSASQGNATLRYRFAAEADGSPMGLKIEINTREHFTVFGYVDHAYAMDTPWFSDSAKVKTYELNELLGTKLRALYQRKKGRDLFDLWKGLEAKQVKPAKIVQAFNEYMRFGETPVSGAEYAANLEAKLKEKNFVTDIRPLLTAGQDYDPHVAAKRVMDELVELMD